jgi:hypothetical protein
LTKWEYKWVRPYELSPRIMDSLGGDGWEFVGEIMDESWAVFKRPKPANTYTITFEGKPCDNLKPEERIVCHLDEPGASELSVACCCAGLDEPCDGECRCG